jgi:3-phenylpropionate/cinnamic acid dioxygenase small subunit
MPPPAAALDARDLDRWPGFFTEDGVYRLPPRGNFDGGLPLCALAFDSRAMLKDRVVGAPRQLKQNAQDLHCEASDIVIRTGRDAMP